MKPKEANSLADELASNSRLLKASLFGFNRRMTSVCL